MPNLNKICDFLNLTQTTESTQRISCSKTIKISVLVGLAALSIIFIVLGALNLAGGASLALLICGSVYLSFFVFGVLLAKLVKKQQLTTIFTSTLEIPRQPVLNSKAEAALAYASNRLDAERDGIELSPWVGLRPPMNEDISYLMNLRSDKYQEVLAFLQTDASDSSKIIFPTPEAASNPEFTSAVTELLQLSFAIGIYSLRDLESYRERYDVESNLEALARQNSAYYRTFYMMSTAYSLQRSLHMYCSHRVSQEDIEARRSRFYQEGTVESEWRSLYNSFCEQARWYLGNEEEADQRECRLIKHSKADLDPSFGYQGTTPT
ncbi:hypothetical protein [Chlamydia sp. 04-14]|uniref:hypothetical protein n=1 Tax=Chlamydia TaxID=810 RepID=UPI002FC5F0EB